jgi:6-phosphogluconolactonase
MSRLLLFVACSTAGQIDVFEMDPLTGRLSQKTSKQRLKHVRSLAVEPTKSRLYAVQNTEPGTLHAFDVERTGTLVAHGPTRPLPATAAYISLDTAGRYLLSASYTESLILTSAIEPSEPGQGISQSVLEDVGKAHAILPSPDNKFLYYTSLAQDQVFWCHFDADSGAISDHRSVTAEAGSGPRHLRFSPQGEQLYVLNELRGTIDIYDRTQSTGSLQLKQTISSVPDGLNMIPGRPRTPSTPDPSPESIWCAELRLTPDGRFLYTTERASSTLSIFTRDPNSGILTYLDTVATEQQPRGMNIDPTGRYLVACGELSDRLAVYSIDQHNGSLTLVDQHRCAAGPMWIEIQAFGFNT